MKVLLKTIYYLVFAAIIVVGLILVAPIVPIENNIETKVVLSGSMEPAIPVGSVIVIRPQESYATEDIITFGEDTRTSIPTTHRIINSRIQDGEVFFTTKGDANQDPDAREVSEEDVKGKVLFSIPFLGYIIDFAKRPIGFILLIAVPAGLIVIDEIRKIVVEVVRMRKKKQQRQIEKDRGNE